MVSIGKHVLLIDTSKVGRGEVFSSESPIQCHLDKLVHGVKIVGKHDGEVTDLSMCQWMITRLVSSSVDGTVRICFILHSSHPISIIFVLNIYISKDELTQGVKLITHRIGMVNFTFFYLCYASEVDIQLQF